MEPSLPDTNPWYVAIIVYVVFLFIQRILNDLKETDEVRRERITKLLLPLHNKIMAEDIDFSAEIMSENGDPTGFIDNLPNYYTDVIKILEENLFLADDELTEKAYKFIAWAKVEKYRSDRFDKVNFGKQDDEPLIDLKECVKSQYRREKFLFENRGIFSRIHLLLSEPRIVIIIPEHLWKPASKLVTLIQANKTKEAEKKNSSI